MAISKIQSDSIDSSSLELGPLSVDAANSRIGIGTSSPSVLLHLKGSNFSSAIRWEETSGNNNFYVGPLNASGDFGIDNNSTSGYIRLVTNSTERMRIDTSGRVTMPYQPSFKATNSTTGQINTNDVELVWPDTSSYGGHNIGNHYNTSNGRFTAPIAGRYLFAMSMLTNNANSSNPYVSVWYRINGTPAHYIGHNHTSNWIIEGGAVIFNLSVNDYVDVYLQYGSGHYGTSYSYFSGCLIG